MTSHPAPPGCHQASVHVLGNVDVGALLEEPPEFTDELDLPAALPAELEVLPHPLPVQALDRPFQVLAELPNRLRAGDHRAPSLSSPCSTA